MGNGQTTTFCGIIQQVTTNRGNQKEMTAEEKGRLAKEYFLEGYNCAQSVLLAFCDETGLSKDQAARLASSFGGGMGRLREVCGAVSSMFTVLGITNGYSDPRDKRQKDAQYARVQRLAGEFRKTHHSVICRDLLLDVETTDGSASEERTKQYYERRPCACYVEDAAKLIARELEEGTSEPEGR
jgi:C_GCAxxG_C_C family probable redox protein